MARHYLDFASTAPLRPEAAGAIASWLERGTFGDPGRPYEEGRAVSQAIEQARESLATLLGVRPRQVIFTSSGTESANWASFAARRQAGPQRPIACAGVEHSAVRLAAERQGPVAEIPVDTAGRIDLDALDGLLAGDPLPALVHCQYANHEVGTIQPVAEVVAVCRRAGVPVHVDACAAIGQLPVDLGQLDADFVSVSGHKFGAPAGVGALVLRRGARVEPLLVGGDQERARRAGTEAVLPIVGLGAAAAAIGEPQALELASTSALAFTERIAKIALGVEGVVQYGDPDRRLPHLVCFGVAGVEAEGVLLGLDRAGVAVHSGSACSSESVEPSPVLEAMGVDADRSLRCSVGWSTTDADLDAFESSFPAVVASLRALAS